MRNIKNKMIFKKNIVKMLVELKFMLTFALPLKKGIIW